MNVSKTPKTDVNTVAPQVRLVPLDTLIPYERNANHHTPAHIAQVANSILDYGWTNPILVDGQTIVAGHGRRLSTLQLYSQGRKVRFPDGTEIPMGYVPVIDCSGWTEAQRRAYILADNQLNRASEWNNDMLRLELMDLEELDVNLESLGFNTTQLDEILKIQPIDGSGDDRDPDAVPDLPDEYIAKTQMGDCWILGPHRLYVGDATLPESWLNLMQGEQAAIVWTDPPYNVDIGEKNESLAKASGRSKSNDVRGVEGIANDWMPQEEFDAFLLKIMQRLFEITAPGGVTYISHSDKMAGGLRATYEAAGFHFSQNLIWKKSSMTLCRTDFHYIHEPILYGWKKGSRHRWNGGRKLTTLVEMPDAHPFKQDEDGSWYFTIGDVIMRVEGTAKIERLETSMLNAPKPARSDLHPTQKPVELVERMISNSARKNDIVVDAFSGSGTTLIAAERLGMCARVMELDLRFADVAIRRWQDLTGRRAVHAITGEEFPAIDEPRKEAAPVIAADGDKF